MTERKAPQRRNHMGGQIERTSTESTIPRVTPDLPELDETCALPSVDQYPTAIRISARADRYLDNLATAITLGIVGLHQLRGGLLAVALAVDTASRDELSRAAWRIGRLEYECDRLHFIAYNRGKNGADFDRAQTSRLWAEAVTA